MFCSKYDCEDIISVSSLKRFYSMNKFIDKNSKLDRIKMVCDKVKGELLVIKKSNLTFFIK